jgi:virginiamycin B lyase
VNTQTDEITIYKIPHREGDAPGGLIAGRLADFPRHDSTSNAHSLAESKVDGHIFITPSAQRRLVEFDPKTKNFTLHEMDQGMYPHTIRVDHDDNVWFTLALSNQISKFDRGNKTFKYYDLPARSFKEKVLTKYIYFVFKIINMGVPLPNWLPIDRVSSGVPLVYGIDITPDNKVWFARLHTKEIGVINPQTDEIKMIPTPFWGPRRLRTDNKGNLWIGAFGESKLAKYTPGTNEFKLFDLPVNPLGSETPYSVNVHHASGTVWVTGNQSDSLHILDMEKENWKSVSFSRRTTFTRDVEFAENGEAYTSNSNFPSWQIEDSQPTLIQIKMD